MTIFTKLANWRKKHFPTAKERMEARNARYQAWLQSPEGLRIQKLIEEDAKAEAENKKRNEEYQAKIEAKKQARLDAAVAIIEMIEQENKSLKGLGLRFYEAWEVPYTIWYKRSTGFPPAEEKLIISATDDDQYLKVYDVNNDYRNLDKRIKNLIFTDESQIESLYKALQMVDLDVSDVEFDFSEMLGG